MLINIFIVCILVLAPVAFFGACCAITAMVPRKTPLRIIAPFVLIAGGWAFIMGSGASYLLDESTVFWPHLMLIGVVALAIGYGLLFLVNRRNCRCIGCPGLHSMQGKRCMPPVVRG